MPVAARHLYPRVHKLASVVSLPALWFEDNCNLMLWLYRTRHKLFGSDLQEKLDYLGAGVILQVRWSQAGLTLTQLGENPLVAEEETRLLDLSSLNEVHSDRLESYHSSMRLILVNGPQPLKELYEQLCLRQQHSVNRNTVARSCELLHELFGVQISEGSLAHFLGECYDQLAEPEQVIRQGLIQVEVTHNDETGLYTLGLRRWLQVMCTAYLTFYACHSKRGKKATDEIGLLPHFRVQPSTIAGPLTLLTKNARTPLLPKVLG